ncbi:MAG: cytochrome oxidase subunit III [Ignavibacteriales bacterium CG12_big_fil_rev_8_21_14_0_65_30_8]|nr:MAG: cytochrome oxidase subunit III [Ignavibacteriales bacterium CG12_big_fil_rev_8_21_14_0_65_30_8]
MKLIKYFSTKLLFSLIFFLLSPMFISVLAQGETESGGIGEGYYNFIILLFVLLIVVIFAFLFLFGMKEVSVEEEELQLKTAKVPNKHLQKIRQFLTRSTPIEKETDILLEHEYDGIRELNNRIPPWFNYLFIATIIFAVIYFFDYEIFKSSPSQIQEYNMEIQAASLQKEELMKTGSFLDENSVTVLDDIASLNKGKEIFTTNCVACHRPDAGGLVGPNLTDDYWIHGGGIKNIFKTITNGVPEKGMISWKSQLNPKQIQEVGSYIISLYGTNPVNPKPPEGEKYKGE